MFFDALQLHNQSSRWEGRAKHLLCCLESADIRHFEVCKTNREGVRCFDITDKVKEIGIYLWEFLLPGDADLCF